jgi:hypothetical protein
MRAAPKAPPPASGNAASTLARSIDLKQAANMLRSSEEQTNADGYLNMSKTIRSSLDSSKASTVALLEELRQNGQPVVLTINGQKELQVLDVGSYRLLLDLIERLETIEGVSKSMEAFEGGQGRPAREALEELRQKHGISS